MSIAFSYFFQFLVGHAAADFVFQPQAMGKGKDRNSEIHREVDVVDFPPWFIWLTAHSLIHGGAVFLVTGYATLGAVEVLLHWIIDFAKCEGWLSFWQDQAFHVGCKVAYCVFLLNYFG